MATQDIALRKRQQIDNANRMMFIWVAAVSVVVGIAAVISLFLLQKAWFNEKVLAVKSTTASVLTNDNQVVPALKDQIRVLNTNQALKSSMTSSESQPVQVVLDALPSDANSSALGSSLQEKFLNDPLLTVVSLNVTPVPGVESQTNSGVQSAAPATPAIGPAADPNQIDFSFSVSVNASNVSALKNLLQRLESSIRAIDVTSLTVQTQNSNLLMSVQGCAFYEPAKTVQLKNETVKP